MIISVSEYIIIVLGIFVCAFSAWGIYAPDRLLKLVSGAMSQNWGLYVAVIVRLALGLALIIAAPGSRFPLIFQVLGWLAIIAAVVLVAVGSRRIRILIAWFEGLSILVIRLWLLFGLVFGGFLFYGIV